MAQNRHAFRPLVGRALSLVLLSTTAALGSVQADTPTLRVEDELPALGLLHGPIHLGAHFALPVSTVDLKIPLSSDRVCRAACQAEGRYEKR